MDGKVIRWMDGWKSEERDGCMDGWEGEGIDGWEGKGMDGRVKG